MNKGRICVSVCADRASKMIENIRRAEQFADVIEVRFDCLETSQIVLFNAEISKSKLTKPILATFRSPEQGGNGAATAADRSVFQSGDGIAFWAVDVEEDNDISLDNAVRRIASFHDFSGIPADINEIFERLAASNADVVKIAVTATDVTDAISVWKLIETAGNVKKEIIPIAMGDAGKWTRILGPAYGSFLTFAALDPGGETAPGQVTCQEMSETYRVRDLNVETRVHGIIGNPVSQSLSTYMHNPAFASQGINAVFIPFLVREIGEFMRRMVRPETREVEINFGGFSVTMPHKQSIMQYLDEIDPIAKTIGAVNTVKVDGDKLTGYNTDAHGFLTPLKIRFGDLNRARAAVFGAGGAARACLYALKQEGADVEVFVRDANKAKAFTDEFQIPVSVIADVESQTEHSKASERRSNAALASFDIIVNATPVGMSGPNENESLFTAEDLSGAKFVYDLVTKPYDTPLIREAKKAGVIAIGGLEMLVAQGAKQFEIWTGKQAPVEQMKEAVLARITEIQR